MFGYRLIHKDVLDALLGRVNTAPSFTTQQGAATVRVIPTDAPPVVVPAPLPQPVRDAIAGWGQADAPRLYALAQEWMDSGEPPELVAQRLAAGDDVDD